MLPTRLRQAVLALALIATARPGLAAPPTASSPVPSPTAPTLPASAFSVESSDDSQQLRLRLSDCIGRALGKNIDISIQRIGPQVASAEVLSARGIYDLNLQAQVQYGASQYQTSFDTVSSSTTRSGSYAMTVSQLTPLGSTVGLTMNTSSSQNNLAFVSNEYTSFSGATFSQPLLKGFGSDITEAQIHITRVGQSMADAAFETQVEQIISDVASAYYDLLYQQNNLASQEKSLSLAQQLLDDNKVRLRIGTMTPLDVSQANAEVASRRDSVLQARQSLLEQENVLKRLISDDFAAMVGQHIVPAEAPPVDLKSKPPLADMTAALQNRPDYREALDQAKQRDIQLVFDQNQVLPQLNLNASYGYAGIGTNLMSSLNTVTSTQYPQWYVGFSVQVPWQNRNAKGQLENAKLQKLQAILQIKKLEQDILVQVNNASTRLGTNQQRVSVARTALAYSRDALDAEQRKLGAGTSTTYTVLQMQRDLQQAETSELQAIADVQKAQVELYRVEGLTLRAYHVVLDHPR
jgi:outer membrane protein TolC